MENIHSKAVLELPIMQNLTWKSKDKVISNFEGITNCLYQRCNTLRVIFLRTQKGHGSNMDRYLSLERMKEGHDYKKEDQEYRLDIQHQFNQLKLRLLIIQFQL